MNRHSELGCLSNFVTVAKTLTSVLRITTITSATDCNYFTTRRPILITKGKT